MTAVVQRAAPPALASLPPAQRRRWDRIVRAALEMLEDGEYEQIQVRDVAKRAGVALGTLYRYFASKEHLYAAVMLWWVDSFNRGLQRSTLPEDPGDALKELLRRSIAAFVAKPQFLRVEIVMEGSNDIHARELISEFAGEYAAAYHGALGQLPDEQAAQIEIVIQCVLTKMLHSYALDRVTVERVYEVVLGTVDLVFSPPPRARRATTIGAPT
ncbi:MAG: putative TetR family transcriptional regulator [Ilumatobacteraceae bacterium]|nr:putative TetR family transcriptional regulator [Ilumatobacteraceae bacterium]